MINDLEKHAFKQELENIKTNLQLNIKSKKESHGEGESLHESTVGGELSLYDNHPADSATELFERSKDFALEEHNEQELEKVNKALEAIENNSYGKCLVCNKDIPLERLEAIPTTQYCIEHSNNVDNNYERPAEEQTLTTGIDNTFVVNKSEGVVDYEDSFQEVARYGTSETPSDLIGDYRSYEELYNDYDISDLENTINTLDE